MNRLSSVIAGLVALVFSFGCVGEQGSCKVLKIHSRDYAQTLKFEEVKKPYWQHTHIFYGNGVVASMDHNGSGHYLAHDNSVQDLPEDIKPLYKRLIGAFEQGKTEVDFNELRE